MSMNPSLSAQDRLQLYLKMLYSKDVLTAQIGAAASDPQFARLLQSVDESRRQRERGARVAQLAAHLEPLLRPLWETGTRSSWLELVSSFAAAPDFWIARGRSLAENFALFAAAHFERAEQPALAELTRLCGMVSGLSGHPERPSPWADARALPPELAIDDAIASECFLARTPLVDEHGRPDARAAAHEHRRWLVFVCAFGDGSTLIGSSEAEIDK